MVWYAQVNAAAVATEVDWATVAKDLEHKSPLEIMDHVSLCKVPSTLAACFICVP